MRLILYRMANKAASHRCNALDLTDPASPGSENGGW